MSIPDWVHRKIQEAKAQNLTRLDLSVSYWLEEAPKKRLKQIPLEVFKLRQLTELNLRGNQLSSLHPKIGQLTRLTHLNLRGNQLSSLPPEISQLNRLTELNLSNNQLSRLPPEIGQLTHLTGFDSSNNQLSSLPPEIGQLTQLTYLYLSGNQLSSLTPEISQLTRLTYLYLDYNQLSHLPPEISQLTRLTYLYLIGNQLSHLPPEISQLTQLTYLYLSGNQLSSLPPEISQLTHLTGFDSSNNQLSSLPPEIGQLTQLTDLDLRGNKLSSLPPEIGQLTQLTDLDLRGNKLSSLPPEISQLTQLTDFDLSNNPLEIPPLEICRKGIEAIREYFRNLEQENYDIIYEAKVLVVGEGESGKTTLIKKILNPDYPVPHPEDATHGILIKKYRFSIDEKHEFCLNMWDFGGQEIYHETHQFFLTKRSLYALVSDTRKDHIHIDYWLNIVGILSDNSPMLIIKNEKNNLQVDIGDESQIKGRFGEMIKEIIGTNLANNEQLSPIIEAIQYYIKKLPHVGIKIPKSWANVRRAIETDTRDYITINEYLEICDNNGYTASSTLNDGSKSKDGRLILSQFLHDLGIILHFQDDEVSPLYDTVILNPEWGTQAVYELLKRENNPIKKNSGKFTFQDLKIIWSHERYKGKYRELIELMQRFKLCYELPDKTYIAPQLLSTNAPEYDWNKEDNLRLKYHYDFMPRGILTRFIVEMHRYIEEPKVWRSGVILTKDNTRAEVIETYNSREIIINLKGANQRGLLEVISAKFDEIHDSYHRLKVDKLIPCICSKCVTSSNPGDHKLEKLYNFLGNKTRGSQCEESGEIVDIYRLIDGTIGINEFNRSSPHNSVIFNLNQGDNMQNPIHQTHSGHGDNVAGNVQNNTYQGPVGIGQVTGNSEIKGNAKVAGIINEYGSQKLEDIAQELTSLLDFFEQKTPSIPEAMQRVNTAKENYPDLNKPEIIEATIINQPTLKTRLLSAGKTVAIETIKVFLPPVGVAIEAIKSYQNPG